MPEQKDRESKSQICRVNTKKNNLEKYQELHDRLLEIHECGETLEGTKRELWEVIESLEEKLEGESDV